MPQTLVHQVERAVWCCTTPDPARSARQGRSAPPSNAPTTNRPEYDRKDFQPVHQPAPSALHALHFIRSHPLPARSESDLRFLPTTYTACLLDSALRHVAQRPARSGFEVGVGGGYVMAALLQAGVERFEGVDILPDAVVSARRLLEGLGLAHRAEVNEGDLWSACEHRRFDLIVANLPQFPLKSPLEEEHPPSWSNGGPDGRLLIEPFIEGLPLHLEPGGTSLMTHNLFIDLPRTLRLLNSTGLIVREVARNLVPLSAQRVQQLRAGLGTWNNDDDLCAAHGLTCVGPQVFAAFAVLEIRKPPVEHG